MTVYNAQWLRYKNLSVLHKAHGAMWHLKKSNMQTYRLTLQGPGVRGLSVNVNIGPRTGRNAAFAHGAMPSVRSLDEKGACSAHRAVHAPLKTR